MSNEIVSAIIQAAGTVIAAIIGVGYLEKIIHKEIVPGFLAIRNQTMISGRFCDQQLRKLFLLLHMEIKCCKSTKSI